MGQRKDCLVKYVFFAVLMVALCGCAQCDRLVLSTGESVETLYYHECRMPDEVMTEMWIDFPSRRLRVKCGLHDALGWSGSFAARNSRHGRTVDRRRRRRGCRRYAGGGAGILQGLGE